MTKKLLIQNRQSIGDVVTITAVVRAIHETYPGEFITSLDCTGTSVVYKYNPYIVRMPENEADIVCRVEISTPVLRKWEKTTRRHMVECAAYQVSKKIGLEIPITNIRGDLYLSDKEKERRYTFPYWVIVAGGKNDQTTKWWHPDYWQELINLTPHIHWVQIGKKLDQHYPLRNVTNLLDKTSIREMMSLIYNSEGVISPITAATHIAGAFQKPAVTIAGGKESPSTIGYPEHIVLSNIGQLSCCKKYGCWKFRCQLFPDYIPKNNKNPCPKPVQARSIVVPKCMANIKPEGVVEAIEKLSRNNAQFTI